MLHYIHIVQLVAAFHVNTRGS